MAYFDDLEFVSGGIPRECTAQSDQSWPDFFCFMFIPEGPIYYGVDGGAQSVLEGPHAFWHHPEHTYQYGPTGESWYHNWVSFRGTRAERFVEQGLMPLSKNGYVRVSQPAVFAEAFRELVPIVHERNPSKHPRGVLILEGLLRILLDDARRPPEAVPYDRELSELNAAILENPYQEVNFELEAERMGLSYSHFRRVFRIYAGWSPYDYLLRRRMQRAARELRETDRQVKDVAREAGYDDPAQFCKLFKKKIGLSPARFRTAMP
jgi:AraC-like DNA-binding protein